MSAIKQHGVKGAYVGGDWVDIEDCASQFNIQNGSDAINCHNADPNSEKCKACPRSRTRNIAAKQSDDGAPYYDVVIIGAGCIGTAIARELSKFQELSVLLLESADDVTQGATKGNSGIVHAGFDDKPGTRRAQFCWPGNQMFASLDRDLHFGYQKNGSLVLAKNDEDLAHLAELKKRGQINGVQRLRILGKEELFEMEPHVHPDCVGALYSPDAGNLIPYEYAIALAENAVDNGVECRIRRQVCSIMQLSSESGDQEGKGGGFIVCAEHWEPREYAQIMRNEDKVVNTYHLNGSTSSTTSTTAATASYPPAKDGQQKSAVELKSTVFSVLLTALVAMFVSLLIVHYSASTIAEMALQRGSKDEHIVRKVGYTIIVPTVMIIVPLVLEIVKYVPLPGSAPSAIYNYGNALIPHSHHLVKNKEKLVDVRAPVGGGSDGGGAASPSLSEPGATFGGKGKGVSVDEMKVGGSGSKGQMDGLIVGYEKYKCRYVINAAGSYSDAIAAMIDDHSFTIKPRLGDYLLLNRNQGQLTQATLFPCPGPYGKGVLVQTTLWGNLILGPTARDVHNEEHTNMEKEEIQHFILSKCKSLVPTFDPKEVIHAFCGARAKSDRGDWIIEASLLNEDFIHVAGIDSPGLAGSPAIALECVSLLQHAGMSNQLKPVLGEKETDILKGNILHFNPRRAPIITPKDGWKGIRVGPVGKYTDPGQNVICKCEKVTESEIVTALSRSLPIDSTQGMRKRTRGGMGHCQADEDNYNCECRIADIIHRENSYTDIKAVGRRPWPATSTLPQRWIDDKDKSTLEQLMQTA